MKEKEKKLASMEQENKTHEINGRTVGKMSETLSSSYNFVGEKDGIENISTICIVNGNDNGKGGGGGGSSTGGNVTSDVVLPQSVLDKLYHTYSIKQRRAGLIWYLVASILFDIWSLIIPQGQTIGALGKILIKFCIY